MAVGAPARTVWEAVVCTASSRIEATLSSAASASGIRAAVANRRLLRAHRSRRSSAAVTCFASTYRPRTTQCRGERPAPLLSPLAGALTSPSAGTPASLVRVISGGLPPSGQLRRGLLRGVTTPARRASSLLDMEAAIEVIGLRKRFGSAQALDGLSFAVRSGQVTGFVGPNGAGKSTTMRVILGLDTPDSGTALVSGRPYRALRHPLSHLGSLLDAAALQPSR